MEKKQAVVTSDTLTKEQIRELAAKSLAGIKNSYATYSHFTFPLSFLVKTAISIKEIT